MLLIRNAAQVVSPPPAEAPLAGKAMGAVVVREGVDVLCEGDRIAAVGPGLAAEGAQVIDAGGGVVVPGFVDPHTHLVFAGSREHELEWKLQGCSYQEILAAGGGILRTVRDTRAATEDELYAQSLTRLARAVAHGTTTIEIKSGYGLDIETELKQLRVARRLSERGLADVTTTFLGAHAFPPEMARAAYIDIVVNEMLPQVAPLADACDVFCEEGVYTVAEARRILAAAREYGLALRVHADEFGDTGGGRLAAELRALSADHLAGTAPEVMAALRDAGTVGVLLPGTPLALLSEHFAPAREMTAVGLPVALATDCNPNCYSESMLLAQQLAVFRMRMTPAEALTAATLNAAFAAGRPGRGAIAPGWRADLLVCDIPDWRHLTYHFGVNHVGTVVSAGETVVEGGVFEDVRIPEEIRGPRVQISQLC